MKRSKKIFIIVAVLFVLATILVGYDISRKTSFPGSKKYLKESIAPDNAADTTKIEQNDLK